jgi:hypothetical protein
MFGGSVDDTDVLSSYDQKFYRINDMNIALDPNLTLNNTERLYHTFYRSTDTKLLTNTYTTLTYSVAIPDTKPHINISQYTEYDYLKGSDMFSGSVDDTDVLSSYDQKLYRIDDMNITVDPNSTLNNTERLYHTFCRSTEITVTL